MGCDIGILLILFGLGFELLFMSEEGEVDLEVITLMDLLTKILYITNVYI